MNFTGMQLLASPAGREIFLEEGFVAQDDAGASGARPPARRPLLAPAACARCSPPLLAPTACPCCSHLMPRPPGVCARRGRHSRASRAPASAPPHRARPPAPTNLWAAADERDRAGEEADIRRMEQQAAEALQQARAASASAASGGGGDAGGSGGGAAGGGGGGGVATTLQLSAAEAEELFDDDDDDDDDEGLLAELEQDLQQKAAVS